MGCLRLITVVAKTARKDRLLELSTLLVKAVDDLEAVFIWDALAGILEHDEWLPREKICHGVDEEETKEEYV